MCIAGRRSILGHVDGVFSGSKLVAHDVGREEAATAGGFGRHSSITPYYGYWTVSELLNSAELTSSVTRKYPVAAGQSLVQTSHMRQQ